jgi:hypothetical protein
MVCAREPAHLAMHRQLNNFLRDERLEAQADRFARAFLLPAESFAGEVWVPTIDALMTLKNDWCCPVAAMIARCGSAGGSGGAGVAGIMRGRPSPEGSRLPHLCVSGVLVRRARLEEFGVDAPNVVVAEVGEPDGAVAGADGVASVAGPLADDFVG